MLPSKGWGKLRFFSRSFERQCRYVWGTFFTLVVEEIRDVDRLGCLGSCIAPDGRRVFILAHTEGCIGVRELEALVASSWHPVIYQMSNIHSYSEVDDFGRSNYCAWSASVFWWDGWSKLPYQIIIGKIPTINALRMMFSFYSSWASPRKIRCTGMIWSFWRYWSNLWPGTCLLITSFLLETPSFSSCT